MRGGNGKSAANWFSCMMALGMSFFSRSFCFFLSSYARFSHAAGSKFKGNLAQLLLLLVTRRAAGRGAQRDLSESVLLRQDIVLGRIVKASGR